MWVIDIQNSKKILNKIHNIASIETKEKLRDCQLNKGLKNKQHSNIKKSCFFLSSYRICTSQASCAVLHHICYMSICNYSKDYPRDPNCSDTSRHPPRHIYLQRRTRHSVLARRDVMHHVTRHVSTSRLAKTNYHIISWRLARTEDAWRDASSVVNRRDVMD